MKVKSTEQLLRQIRTLSREKVLLERRNKELTLENKRMLASWNLEHSVFTRQIKKITNENKLLSAKNQLLESMRK